MDPVQQQEQLRDRKKGANIGVRGILTRGVPKTATGNMRNRPCPCGKKAKYKNCCLGLDEGWQHTNDGKLERPTFAFAPPKISRFDLGSIIGGKHDKTV